MRLPRESYGACLACGVAAELGDGVCARCYDTAVEAEVRTMAVYPAKRIRPPAGPPWTYRYDACQCGRQKVVRARVCRACHDVRGRDPQVCANCGTAISHRRMKRCKPCDTAFRRSSSPIYQRKRCACGAVLGRRNVTGSCYSCYRQAAKAGMFRRR